MAQTAGKGSPPSVEQATGPDMEITALHGSRTPAAKAGDLSSGEPSAMPPAAAAARAAMRLAMLGGWGAIALLAVEGAAATELLPWAVAQLALGYAATQRAAAAKTQKTQLRLLAENVADSERKRISLDLHDSAIQPYLGLKLGLEALRRKVVPGNPLAQDIDELYRMTQDSIAELRGYVRVLRGDPQQGNPLATDLHRQIERFHRFYGLCVVLRVAPDMALDDRMAAEIVRMVGEALSNVGRHTASRAVTVSLSVSDGHAVAEIVNRGGAGREAWRPFTPVSLTRRAEYLGGRVEISPEADGGTAVRIIVPI